MELKKNTYEDWQNAYEELQKSSDNVIEVKINTKETDSESIINLRYFFPLAMQFLRVKESGDSTNASLTLDIKLTGGAGEADRSRLRIFLSQILGVPGIIIRVDGQTLNNMPWQTSRIFPLCWVQREDEMQGGFGFKVLNESIYDEVKGENRIDRNAGIYPELANELLQHVLNPEHYQGTNDYKFSPEEKKTLRQEVDDCLHEHLGHMSILAQIIWLYILRELIELKELYGITEEGREHPHIHNSIMIKSRLDAISYGESMYQLIENACMHSSGHLAWFGFRVHRAGRNVTMSKLIDETRTRNMLYEDYQSCFIQYDKNGKPRANDKNIFNEDYRFYFEFFVLDDASDQLGMIGHYNQNIKLEQNNDLRKSECIEDLFNIGIRQEQLKDHVEDITTHYGLRLLRKIISVNGGYLIGRTPDGKKKTQCYFDGNPVPEQRRSESYDSYVTEWNAILPIEYKWPERTTGSDVVNGKTCFGDKIERPRSQLYFFSREKLFHECIKSSKSESIKVLHENLQICMAGLDKKELEDAVILLQADSSDIDNLELFSKALFAQIAEINFKKEDPVALRIAILFDHKDAIFEFIRLFSVFYPDGEQADMQNVQIALCEKNKLYGDIYDVAVMLVGEYLSSTYGYARLFAYHHTGNALEYLPLLDYLTMKENREEQGNQAIEDISLFPFELCLPTDFGNHESQEMDWRHNWFLDKMKHILNTSIQDENYGCLIDDIHIRLGSKLHLNRFYEAELLFHNMGNIVRFAYIIVRELLYGNQKLLTDQPVLLLGYEKYSSMLLMQVEYWIKRSGQFSEVNTAIVYDSEDEKEVKVRPYFDEEKDVRHAAGSVQIVTVIPIGTTLSTVYKMQNVSRQQLKNHFGDQWSERAASRNFCLILVNKDLTIGNLSKISARYWSNLEWEEHLVTLKRELIDEQKVQVRYFIETEAEWLDPKECPVCRSTGGKMRPIIDGKHSDIMPGAIFSLWGEHAGTFRKLVGNIDKNRKRIDALYGNVFYSHIYHGNNHFQFYIDFKKLYEENKEDIDSDLRKNCVQQDCFHVIVSPLQLSNSTFVKAVIDNVFDGNVRFLHMNITESYREEVRTKFSHLTQEFRRMRQTNPKAKFSFHFVDTSIVTGGQLNRARLLIQMLLNQSNVNYSDVCLFDRVFLLVNRCSYDTANYFVYEPEKNMYAYIHLAIPSYNTENDFCPACKVTAKFQLLGKRSSTERLSHEFLRLQEKHKKRTFEAYHDWLMGSNQYPENSSKEDAYEKDGVLLTSPAYLGWLKQWLYVNVSENNTEFMDFVFKDNEHKDFNEHDSDWKELELAKIVNIKKGLETYANLSGAWNCVGIVWGESESEQYNKREDYLKKISETNLIDIAKYISDENQKEEFLSSAKSIIKTHLVGVRDYMRLKAMQKSYEELEDVQFERNFMKKEKYRDAVINLIGNAIVSESDENMEKQLKNIDKSEKDRFLIAYNVEWLISYIKVLSRAQIVNYYEYRQAIVGVMSDMLRVLYWVEHYNSLKKAETENWKKIVKLLGKLRQYDSDSTFEEHQLCAKLCCQVHMTLVQRMSDLQINSRVDAAGILTFMQLYSQMVDCYFKSKPEVDGTYIPYIDMPSPSKNIIRYLKATKSATMTSNDDVPCLILAATSDELKKELNNTHKQRSKSTEENLKSAAKYIYIENTRMLYSGMLDIKKTISADVLTTIEECRPADSFSEYMKNLSQKVERCLGNCYENLDKDAKEEELLYQNLLSNFCRFWHKSTGEAPVGKGKDVNPIAYMLRYFMRLEELSDEIGKKRDNDELPYLYEELCRILCGITGFHMCYFTYCHAGNYPEIFAQSGYYIKLMMAGKLLTSVRMDEIIRLARNKDNELLPGIAKITAKEDCDYLVLFIPLIEDRESGDGLYVVFQSDKDEEILSGNKQEVDWKALRKARDVLFLRQRLQEVLSRDYTVLINYRFDYSYVRPISKDNDVRPSAMHISDLHIQKDMSEQQIKRICNDIQKAQEKCGTQDNPAKMDLLIISGDIVDSRDANAPRMEKNYRHAEQLLNHIVSVLWADKSGYLPHDWRRRIIVTSGNHDYASMNQYQAMQKGRVLTSALPAVGESGTMSKFAYYIEFLIHYLDVQVEQLLHNDLNEIRYYRKLNLKILLLNCSGKATPRRTNKMGINLEKVSELLERDVWHIKDEKLYYENASIVRREPFHLVIGHYSPKYELSYFLDQYDAIPGWVWETGEIELESRPLNYLVKIFQEAVQKELEYRFSGIKKDTKKETKEDDKREEELDENREKVRKEFMNQFENLNKALKVLEQADEMSPSEDVDHYCGRLRYVSAGMLKGKKDEDEAVKVVVRKVRENGLYQLLEKYYNWLEAIFASKTKSKDEEWSEEISQLIYEVGESIRMGEQDKEIFEKFINEKVEGMDLYLAGHIHAYAESDNILVADKLFDDNRPEMHGYIIRNLVKGDDTDKSGYQRGRFGTKPTRQNLLKKED